MLPQKQYLWHPDMQKQQLNLKISNLNKFETRISPDGQ
ncbi:MAG: hypothetical protein ACI808_000680 [Paraglaciecola sp.]|jgi:hypothetical protein